MAKRIDIQPQVFLADATYGREIPAGKNPTLLAWYWSIPGGEPVGPFDTKFEATSDANEAMHAFKCGASQWARDTFEDVARRDSSQR